MATTRAKVNPEVLRWARELGGYSIADIASATNTKPERVEQWETGSAQPTLNQLRTIARRLRRPPAFFFRADPPPPDLPQPPDFRRAEDRIDASIELRRDLRSATDRRRQYLELVEPPPPWAPGIDLTNLDPADAAATARQRLGVSIEDQTAGVRDAYQAMHMWIEAVERLGAIVFQSTAFELDEARGASIYFDVLPVILVNAKDAIVARSFTLLHELGHLCMGSGALCEVYGRRLPDVETRCNRFAAAVLMPASAILADIADGDPAEAVGGLARRYKVSEEAAAIRLFELGRLDRATLDRIRAETRQRVAELERQNADKSPQVPYSTRKLRDLGRNYVGAVLDAYHDDRLSLTDVSQYLDVKVPHIWKMEETLDKVAESRR
jgi:Zn-dependent peptidase ImmA (M78 family)/transcriptional regulator with XRE-family HTH domain